MDAIEGSRREDSNGGTSHDTGLHCNNNNSSWRIAVLKVAFFQLVLYSICRLQLYAGHIALDARTCNQQACRKRLYRNFTPAELISFNLVNPVSVCARHDGFSTAFKCRLLPLSDEFLEWSGAMSMFNDYE